MRATLARRLLVVLLALQATAAADTTGAHHSSATLTEESNAGREHEGTERILIKKVYLIGRQGTVGDVLVNILIVDGKLDVVTKDDIAPATTRIAVDAEKGFLMGNLQIGAPPSFVILDRNPREHFDVVLDSDFHGAPDPPDVPALAGTRGAR